MAQVDGVFDPPLQEAIKDSKILVVGAGGIGCELLKNIVLSGNVVTLCSLVTLLHCAVW